MLLKLKRFSSLSRFLRTKKESTHLKLPLFFTERPSLFDRSTGQTGGSVFAVTSLLYAISNEIIVVLHPENILLASVVIFFYFFKKNAASPMADYIDSIIENRRRILYGRKDAKLKLLNEQIQTLKDERENPKVVELLKDIQVDLNHLEEEFTYRKMVQETLKTIETRLNGIVALETKIISEQQNEIVDQLVGNVLLRYKSLKSDTSIDDCIREIGKLKLI